MQKLSVAVTAVAPLSKANGAESQANANTELADVPHAFHTLLKKQTHSNQATQKIDKTPQVSIKKGLQPAPQADERHSKTKMLVTAHEKNVAKSVRTDIKQEEDYQSAATAVDEMVALLSLPSEAKPVLVDDIKTNEAVLENQKITDQTASILVAATVAEQRLANQMVQQKALTTAAQTQAAGIRLPSQAADASSSPSMLKATLSAVSANEIGEVNTNIATLTPEQNLFEKQLAEAKAPMMMPQEKMSEVVTKLDIDKVAILSSTVSTLQNTMQPVAVAPVHMSNTVAPTVASQMLASYVIEADFAKAGWNQAISQRVVWMAGAGEQSATLTLNPPDLGPLQVVVQVHNGQADTTFTSDNADVRQALQDGMEHLREKMRESGLQLGQTNVQSGEQSQKTFEQATQHRASQNRMTSSTGKDEVTAQPKSMTRVTNGLVDTFA